MSLVRVLLVSTLLVVLNACSSGSGAATPPPSTVRTTLATTQAVSADTTISVENLLGHVQVRQGAAQLQITATVVAGGRDHAAAQALADSIKLDVTHDNAKLVVHVAYPVDQHDSYRYVADATDHVTHNTNLFDLVSVSTSRSSLEYQGKSVSVYRGQNKGVPVHVDLVINLPVGSAALIENHVGFIEGHDLQNSLSLQTDSGDISVNHLQGSLNIKIGSGDATLSDIRAALIVEAGSGDITVKQVHGNLKLQAGSGDISANTVQGEKLSMQTGSGDIEIDTASGLLDLHAGSGDIALANPGNVPNLIAACGSGDIELHGDLAGLKSFDLQAGSGNVTLASSSLPNVHLEIEGFSIKAGWAGLRNLQSREGHFSGDVGTATGQGKISTASGDVTLKP